MAKNGSFGFTKGRQRMSAYSLSTYEMVCMYVTCQNGLLFFFLSTCHWLLCRLLRLHLTVCSYPKVAIFTTNVHAENRAFINHKCVCGALNRHFWVGAVRCWRSCCPYVSRHCQVVFFVFFGFSFVKRSAVNFS